MLLVALY